MPVRWSRVSTAASLLVVLALVAGPASVTVAGQDPGGSPAGTDGISVTTTAPTCLDSSPFPADGWVQSSQAANGTILTANVTVAHDANRTPTVTAERRGDAYVLVVGTTERDRASADGGDSHGFAHCETGSRLVVTAVLSQTDDEVAVEVNGTVVGSVDADGVVPSMSTVSGPFDA